MVAPTEPELIRDRPFAEDLASLAARNGIVVELAGGLLSHAFYVLQRHGVHVECVGLFGTDVEVAEYNKLVRDNVPATIEARGEHVEVIRLSGPALLEALRKKLVEEAFEALDAKAGEELIGELADVQEVVRAIAAALGVPFEQIEAERGDKRSKRGGFDRGLMLTTTAAPHSLADSGKPAATALTTSLSDESVSLIKSAELPSVTPYRKPDLRKVGAQAEKLFTFETDLNRQISEKLSSSFAVPVDAGSSRQFAMSVEFIRSRSTIRGTIRLRLEPVQLTMELDGPALEQDGNGHEPPGPTEGDDRSDDRDD